MKRFYREVKLIELPGGGFVVTLDDKTLRSPGKRELILSTEALGEAVREEWAQQGVEILPHDMPMMQLAATVIDRVAPQRDIIIDTLLKFGETDLLCYRASHPASLVTRQQQVWDPLILWARQRYDVELATTSGLMPIVQPQKSLMALRAGIAAHADPILAALMTAVGALGSLVIGLALVERQVDAAEAFAAGQLDETYQIEVWGRDDEAAERLDHLRAEVEAADRFLRLIGLRG